jgi:hypothetical protein
MLSLKMLRSGLTVNVSAMSSRTSVLRAFGRNNRSDLVTSKQRSSRSAIALLIGLLLIGLLAFSIAAREHVITTGMLFVPSGSMPHPPSVPTSYTNSNAKGQHQATTTALDDALELRVAFRPAATEGSGFVSFAAPNLLTVTAPGAVRVEFYYGGTGTSIGLGTLVHTDRSDSGQFTYLIPKCFSEPRLNIVAYWPNGEAREHIVGFVNCVSDVSKLPKPGRIVVNSPRAGEVWKVGETHMIRWWTSGYTPSSTVSIQIESLGAKSTPTYTVHGPSAELVETINSGSYSWMIPAGLAGLDFAHSWSGQSLVYNIRIYVGVGEDFREISAVSDGTFQVVAK